MIVFKAKNQGENGYKTFINQAVILGRQLKETETAKGLEEQQLQTKDKAVVSRGDFAYNENNK